MEVVIFGFILGRLAEVIFLLTNLDNNYIDLDIL